MHVDVLVCRMVVGRVRHLRKHASIRPAESRRGLERTPVTISPPELAGMPRTARTSSMTLRSMAMDSPINENGANGTNLSAQFRAFGKTQQCEVKRCCMTRKYLHPVCPPRLGSENDRQSDRWRNRSGSHDVASKVADTSPRSNTEHAAFNQTGFGVFVGRPRKPRHFRTLH